MMWAGTSANFRDTSHFGDLVLSATTVGVPVPSPAKGIYAMCRVPAMRPASRSYGSRTSIT